LFLNSYRSGVFEISASWRRIPDAWLLGNKEFTVQGKINHVLKPSLPYGSESYRIRIDRRRMQFMG
jgi:hypothetical protein